MPKITLIFADGERAELDGPEDEPILKSAHKAGIALASDCEIGDCQTCRAELRRGDVEFDELAFITLEDEEIEQGAVLTCVSMPVSDVEVALPYLRAALIQEQKFNCEIAALDQLSDTTTGLTLTLPANRRFTFHPGQYVNITVPGGDGFRSYSMASGPDDKDRLDFHIRLLPQGVMSDFLKERAAPGGKIELEGPKGVFYLRDGPGPVIMIAGGTGLAPMVSMLRHMRASAPDTGSLPRAVLLCFGVTAARDLYYVDELQALISDMDNAELRLAMVDADEGWQHHRGFVTDLVEAGDVREDTRAYLCGPPPMIAAGRDRLAGLGVAPDAIFAEEFNPTGS